MPAREAALLTLTAMERRGAWSSGQLQKLIRDKGLDRRDAALATQLCFGVLQNQLLLDHYLQHYSTMKLTMMESKLRCALRIGLYQMLFLNKIPTRAAVSQSVELVKRHCKNPRAAGMANGILRNLARHLDNLPTLDRSDPLEYLSLLYSHPKWLVEALAQRLPEEELEALLRWDNGEPPVAVQVNTCRTTAEETAAALEAEGVSVTPHPWMPDCLLLTGTGDLSHRQAYLDGQFYVQDPAARLTVLAARLRPGMRVLDACAAPGGKSFAAAIDMEDEGEVIACDIHPHKKALIEAGVQRLGIHSVTAQTVDGRMFRPAWEGSFDAVLADVPCSGLGVLQKKPEIRYKDPQDWAGLPELQYDILENVSRYLCPGGTLIYSTCTLREEENEAVTARFLSAHPEFRRVGFPLPGPMGEVTAGETTLWPQRLGTDGFYLCRLQKEGAVR